MSIFVWDTCQLTQGGFQYNENHESYTININREGGSNAVRKVTCAWGDAVALAQDLRGSTIEVDGNLLYTEAEAHPVLPSLKVASVAIEPVGIPLTTGTWEQAFLTINYDVPEFGTPGGEIDVLKEESLDVTAFNELIPAEDLVFEDGVVARDLTITVRMIEYRCTLYKQATLPIQAITGLINKVNNGAWTIGAGTVGEGQALYGGAEASRSITDTGAEEWTISHVVYIGSHDQRQRWNAFAGVMEKVAFRNGGGDIYDSGSFASVGL
jgi:hypothetical protein